MNPLKIHFLGTGGGRFATITQLRRTAGLRLEHGEAQVHVDPGPGALVYSNRARLNPQRLDAVVVTHCHPDHYTDAEVLVEAMTHGTRDKRGIIAASTSVLYGDEDSHKSISPYHQGLVGSIYPLEPGSAFRVEGLGFEAVEAKHSDSATVGLKIVASEIGTVGYTSDTAYIPSMLEDYGGSRLLILCTLRPRGNPLRYHMCTDDVLRVLEGARPGCAVLTHFGMMMIRADPEAEASYLEEASGVPTIAAVDGMEVVLGDEIEVKGPRKRDEPRLIDA